MHKISKFLLFMILFFIGSSLHALDFDDIANKIKAKQDNIKTVYFSFDQDTKVVDTNEITHFKGNIYFKEGGSFRVEYSKPYKQRLISDGNKLLLYNIEDKQAVIYHDLKNNERMEIFDFIFNPEKWKVKYDSIFVVQEKGEYVFLMENTGTGEYTKVYMPVTKLFPRLIEREINGFDIVFRVHDLEFDKKLDDSIFAFELPASVDVWEE